MGVPFKFIILGYKPKNVFTLPGARYERALFHSLSLSLSHSLSHSVSYSRQRTRTLPALGEQSTGLSTLADSRASPNWVRGGHRGTRRRSLNGNLHSARLPRYLPRELMAAARLMSGPASSLPPHFGHFVGAARVPFVI
jgi:hypothetical protein